MQLLRPCAAWFILPQYSPHSTMEAWFTLVNHVFIGFHCHSTPPPIDWRRVSTNISGLCTQPYPTTQGCIGKADSHRKKGLSPSPAPSSPHSFGAHLLTLPSSQHGCAVDLPEWPKANWP